jgi:hypothetical protein
MTDVWNVPVYHLLDRLIYFASRGYGLAHCPSIDFPLSLGGGRDVGAEVMYLRGIILARSEGIVEPPVKNGAVVRANKGYAISAYPSRIGGEGRSGTPYLAPDKIYVIERAFYLGRGEWTLEIDTLDPYVGCCRYPLADLQVVEKVSA